MERPIGPTTDKILSISACLEWTRSQPIRTAAQLQMSFPLLSVEGSFPHQMLGPKIRELARLGLSTNAIARALAVDWKTVRKALQRR